MNNINLTDFFSNEYTDFAAYDLVRKIPSYIDGQKNASRKILHTVRQQNIDTFTKVSNLGPKVQDFTQYLHGSLEGTIVNVTADYVGSGNNIPLLQGDGNFGSAFIPVAAASRYIFARQNEAIKNIFRKEDTILLEEQYFEGDKIEPKYYVPVLPMLAINGAEGMSIGFASKILPRDPKEIIKWVTQKASGKRLSASLVPSWNNMSCTVEQGDSSSQWIIKGKFERKTRNQLVITSLPIGYDLKQYKEVLDKLVDDKVIRNYDDLSDNDVFRFDISVDKDFSSKDDAWILQRLKLVKTVTENYTCIDRNNKIVQFSSINDILNAWYEVRLEYNQKRREDVLDNLNKEFNELTAKKIFITGVTSGDIELRNRSEDQIVKDMISYNEILKDYTKFINLSIRVLTKEEIKKLNDKLKQIKDSIKEWSDKTVENISLEDVESVKI